MANPVNARGVYAALTPMLPTVSLVFADGAATQDSPILRAQGTKGVSVFARGDAAGLSMQVQFAHSVVGLGWAWRDLGGPIALPSGVAFSGTFNFAALAYRVVVARDDLATMGNVEISLIAAS